MKKIIILSLFVLFTSLQTISCRSQNTEQTISILPIKKQVAIDCSQNKLLTIKQATLSLAIKKQKLTQFRISCPAYKKMAHAALGELYFQNNNYKQAIKSFRKMATKEKAKTPLQYQLKKAQYALSLQKLNLKPTKAEQLFLKVRNYFYPKKLPVNIQSLYDQYQILKSERIISSEELMSAFRSMRSYKNLGIRPKINITIQFDFDKSGIKSESQQQINELYNALSSEYFKNLNFELIGHTDSKGSKQYNQTLSEKRAKAVKKALQQKQGSNIAQHIFTSGKGETELLLPNQSENSANRRVEIKIK